MTDYKRRHPNHEWLWLGVLSYLSPELSKVQPYTFRKCFPFTWSWRYLLEMRLIYLALWSSGDTVCFFPTRMLNGKMKSTFPCHPRRMVALALSCIGDVPVCSCNVLDWHLTLDIKILLDRLEHVQMQLGINYLWNSLVMMSTDADSCS